MYSDFRTRVKDASVMLLLNYELSAKAIMTFCKTYTTCWNVYYLLRNVTVHIKKCILLIKRLLRNTLRCYLLN